MYSISMRLKLYTCGKLKESPLLALVKDYQKRITAPLEIIEIETRGKKTDVVNKLLLQAVEKSPVLFILDERGEQLSSPALAGLLQRYANEGRECGFVIGEADGLPEEIRSKATHLMAFGKATWPHMLVRVMLLEQLYRAESILKGHPYHRGY